MLNHRRQLQGEENLDFAMALNNFGVFLSRSGDVDKAAHSIESAIQLAQRLAGRDSPLALAWRRNRAGMLSLRGDSDGALGELRDLVGDYETASEPNPVDVALARELLGEQLTAQARRKWDSSAADSERLSDEAYNYLRESLALFSSHFPAHHWNVLRTRCALADILAEKSWRHARADGLDLGRQEARQARELAQTAFDAASTCRCGDARTQVLVKSRLAAAQLADGLVQHIRNAAADSDPAPAEPDPFATAEQLLLSACEEWKQIGLRNPGDRRSLRLVVTWLERLYLAAPALGDDPQRAATLTQWRAVSDE